MTGGVTRGGGAPALGAWWRSTQPRLGVINDAPPAPALVSLLGIARRWCQVFVLTADVPEPPDAVVVCHPRLLRPVEGPVAVWVEDPAEVGRLPAWVTLVLSGRADVAAAAVRRGIIVPEPHGRPAPPEAAWVPPAVRQRLRAARSLPEPLVAEHDGEAWTVLGGRGRLTSGAAQTALACASVAVVTGEALLDALAWGTPAVTDHASAAAMAGEAAAAVAGAAVAGGGSDVLVSPFDAGVVAETAAERRRLAVALSRDPRRCARLSWLGRRCFEQRHAPDLVAGAVVRQLGLAAGARVAGPVPLAAALAELNSGPPAEIGRRVEMATAALTVRTD